MNTVTNVSLTKNRDDVELSTLIWIGEEKEVYILARMTGPEYIASLVSLDNGNLWHLVSAPIKCGFVTLADVNNIIGGEDWGFVETVSLRRE